MECVLEKDLRIAVTYFQHFEKPIDHVLMEGKYLRHKAEARSYHGNDTDNDHILVMAKVKCRKPPSDENFREKRERYSTNKL